MRREELEKQRQQVENELLEAQEALPAHSVRPWQYQRVEELKERLAEIDRALAEATG